MSGSASVLIPSLQGGPRLIRLATLLLSDQAAPTEVVVADNGLDPATCGALRERGARVVEMGGNAGFGQAVNSAARQAEGSILVVTNDDIEPEPGFVAALAGEVEAGAAMVAGVLVQPERPGTIESVGLAMDSLLGWHDHLHGQPLEVLSGEVPAPLGPSGGAAAFSRAAFEAVGGFDEGIFAYTEDVDLALRMRRHGARCEIAAGARATHAISGTLGYGSLEKALVVGRSRGYLMRKYGVLSHPLRGAVALAVEATACTGLAIRHRSLGPAAARIRGWRECRAREAFPPREWATVGVLDGLLQRLAWHRRRPRS